MGITAEYYLAPYDVFFLIPYILFVWWVLDGWAKKRDERIRRERENRYEGDD